MAKPLGLEQLLKMAEDEKSISTKVLIQAIMDALKAQDAKLDQVMATHAANFEERAKGIAKHASLNLGVVEGSLTMRCDGLEKRIHELEHPGKTSNNMRQP